MQVLTVLMTCYYCGSASLCRHLAVPVRRALDWDSVRAAPAVGRLGLEIDRPGSPATEPPSAGLPRRSSAGGLVLTGSHPETYCTVHAAPAESKVRPLLSVYWRSNRETGIQGRLS